MPLLTNPLQVDLKTAVLDLLFQHQTNQEVVFQLQLLEEYPLIVNCVSGPNGHLHTFSTSNTIKPFISFQ